MTGNTWIALGIISCGFAAFAIPYGFHLKANQQSQPGIATSVDQKSSGAQSPNIVINGKGGSAQIIFASPQENKTKTRMKADKKHN